MVYLLVCLQRFCKLSRFNILISMFFSFVIQRMYTFSTTSADWRHDVITMSRKNMAHGRIQLSYLVMVDIKHNLSGIEKKTMNVDFTVNIENMLLLYCYLFFVIGQVLLPKGYIT